MNPHDIQAELRKKGSSQRAIATKCSVSRATVNHVIHGRGVSKRVATAIAEVIGRGLDVIWPETYASTDEQPTDRRALRRVV